MQIIDFLADNYAVIIGLGALGAMIIISVVLFLELPTDKKVAAVKEWLLYAVTEAEKELGGGTGQLKLRHVYDMFISKFKFASFIKFETFSGWVDEALEKMEHLLSTNEKVAAYVENKGASDNGKVCE
jgi:hypothetical protein